MSAAIIAAAKKLIMLFFTDKKFRRFVLGIIALAICIALLPVILLTAVSSSIASAGSEFTVDMTAEQEAQILQLNADGEVISNTLRNMNLPTEILKAQLIYATYFQDVPKNGDFFTAYCSHFQNASGNMEQLISALNSDYGLSIPYDEFMRFYALIRNIHIDKNLFSDTSTKNNIDLAAWTMNAYESGWGYVPYTMGEVLTEDVIADLPPSAVTEKCKKWLSRRTTDNSSLLRSYLFYDFESKNFTDTGGESLPSLPMLGFMFLRQAAVWTPYPRQLELPWWTEKLLEFTWETTRSSKRWAEHPWRSLPMSFPLGIGLVRSMAL